MSGLLPLSFVSTARFAAQAQVPSTTREKVEIAAPDDIRAQTSHVVMTFHGQMPPCGQGRATSIVPSPFPTKSSAWPTKCLSKDVEKTRSGSCRSDDAVWKGMNTQWQRLLTIFRG